jgi:hypothetical protein
LFGRMTLFDATFVEFTQDLGAAEFLLAHVYASRVAHFLLGSFL